MKGSYLYNAYMSTNFPAVSHFKLQILYFIQMTTPSSVILGRAKNLFFGEVTEQESRKDLVFAENGPFFFDDGKILL
jgi:hypothetical protein